MKKKPAPDPANPPTTNPYYIFCTDKWDMSYARNVLLHFVNEKCMNDELEKWLNKNYPSDRD
jgi:hypothetical protein